ncbi:site-specific integrase, partial [bacterium]|nr:site-specific integrase [bacterium]
MDIQLLSEYLEFAEVEKGLSLNTINAYRRDLISFLNYCSDKNIENIYDISRNTLNTYIMNLRGDNLNPR